MQQLKHQFPVDREGPSTWKTTCYYYLVKLKMLTFYNPETGLAGMYPNETLAHMQQGP